MLFRSYSMGRSLWSLRPVIRRSMCHPLPDIRRPGRCICLLDRRNSIRHSALRRKFRPHADIIPPSPAFAEKTEHLLLVNRPYTVLPQLISGFTRDNDSAIFHVRPYSASKYASYVPYTFSIIQSPCPEIVPGFISSFSISIGANSSFLPSSSYNAQM